MDLYTCTSSMCIFDKTPTMPIIIFEIFIIAITVLLLSIFYKYDKKILIKFGIMMIGVFIFEFFTHPMWFNYKLGAWAYVYRDVSWILTIGWSMMFVFAVFMVDKFFPKIEAWKRFLLYIVVMVLLGIFGESAVIKLGIRSYSPEVENVIGGWYTILTNVPVAIFYYVPVFSALVIGFYKYWTYVIDKTVLLPIKRKKLWRSFVITFIGVLFFEIMIEPMVINQGFPQWSYLYRDISFILTGGWVLIIWVALWVVDNFLRNFNLFEKFISYTFIIAIITIPFEFLLIQLGFREYGESSVANFSGLTMPIVNIPIEIIFAIPFYLALVIGFVKCWEYMLENKKLVK